MDFAARTVRYALKGLLNHKLVKKKCQLSDMRYTKYSLSPAGARLARDYHKQSLSISKIKDSKDFEKQLDPRYTR